MRLELIPANTNDSAECDRLVEFVNTNYSSPLPLTRESAASGRTVFFWAKLKETSETVGVTGYMAKTPYLAESVKTVIDSKFRGRGFGEELSTLIEKEVAARGFKKIMTTIYVTNIPMIFIKLKQGYLFEGFHPNHEMPGLHEYSLGKTL